MRAVLKALLPTQGTDIKGQMKSYDALLEACSYGERRADFDSLLGILDSEVRLITPTEPDASTEGQAPASSRHKYYQLTHDFLVPSLRDWLTRKQKETRRGRAELRLAERARLWTTKRETQQLPGLREYGAIRTLTDKQKWTEPQQKMMSKAGRLHLARTAAVLVVLGLLGALGYEINGRFQSRALVDSLLSAKEDAVLGIVDRLRPYRRWADRLLEEQLASDPQTMDERRVQLHIRLALLPVDVGQRDALKTALLEPATPESYIGVLRDALGPPEISPVDDALIAYFREKFEDSALRAEQRFRAALALAAYAPQPDLWSDEQRSFLAQQLIAAVPEQQPMLRRYLRPLADLLLAPLETLFADRQLSETQQLAAASAVADYAARDEALLARMASAATPAQYKVLYTPLVRLGEAAGQSVLLELVNSPPAEQLPQEARVARGKQRAGAAITLLRQGRREAIFDVFRVTDDPESLTQFVHRCRQRGVTATELLECLDEADALRQAKTGDERAREDRVLFGLLLALGEFPLSDLDPAERQPLVDRLAGWYAQDPSSTVHGATGWLLRQWGEEARAQQVDQTAVEYSPDREWFVRQITVETGGLLGFGRNKQSFYFTFIVFEPDEHTIGSPEDERDRESDEARQSVRLTRRLAVLDREVTRAEFEAIAGKKLSIDQWSPSGVIGAADSRGRLRGVGRLVRIRSRGFSGPRRFRIWPH